MSEENITRMSIAEINAKIAAGGDRTDWTRVDALTDEQIEAAMRDDPDWKDHIDEDWSGAQLVIPQNIVEGMPKEELLKLCYELQKSVVHFEKRMNEIAAERNTLWNELKATSDLVEQARSIQIKPIDWKTDGRSMWEDADFPRYDLYRTGSGGYWLAYADRTIRYSPNERDFPSEDAAKAAAQAHKEKRIRAEIAFEGGAA